MKKFTLLLASAVILANTQVTFANFTANLLFAAKLTGEQETPPVTTSGYGVATFILNATRDTLCISVTVRDMSSAITAAHIHEGSYGLAGPPIIDLTPYINGNRINATLTGGMINPQVVGALIARQYYINVHTTNYVDGEIRGQIELETDFHFKAFMSGAEVVPPANTPAIGVATFNLQKDYMYLTIKAQVTGLSGPITTAQLHYGAPGVNGPEVAWLDSFINGNTIVCEIPDTLFIYDLLAGNIYININTAANPIGEVRGQIYLQSDFAFDTWLDGQQEVPPTPSGSTGSGSITFSPGLDTVYYDVVYDSLLDTPTAAHFHDGTYGVSGPPVVDLTTSINGNHLSGMATSLPPDFVAKCLLGSIYLNVHSAAFPNGEIRGQVDRLAYEGFAFSIDGSQETPPNPSPAIGSGFVSIDPEERSAHYRMVVDDLTGPLTEAHFHNAPPGVAGPPVFDLTAYFTAGATNVSASNYWTDVDFWVPFSTTFSDMFMNNEMYVNFHTAANPNGEVRGNILQGGECFITTGIAGTGVIADGWMVYPVPASSTATIQFDGTKNSHGEIQVTDLSGRIVLNDAINISAGENKIDLDVSSLSSGIYGVRLISEKERSSVGKLVKQ
jgi:hypothetical protein